MLDIRVDPEKKTVVGKNTIRFKADCFKVGNRRVSMTKVRALLIACNRRDERALAFDDLQIVKP